jgi:hypothetical protein
MHAKEKTLTWFEVENTGYTAYDGEVNLGTSWFPIRVNRYEHQRWSTFDEAMQYAIKEAKQTDFAVWRVVQYDVHSTERERHTKQTYTYVKEYLTPEFIGSKL